jgi:hypothetical protein
MVTTEIPERRCDWCYPANLYRVDRRSYEWVLGLLDLHPYVCCICGARGVMIGRGYAYNWRRRRVRIRIVFRLSLGGLARGRVLSFKPGQRNHEGRNLERQLIAHGQE